MTVMRMFIPLEPIEKKRNYKQPGPLEVIGTNVTKLSESVKDFSIASYICCYMERYEKRKQKMKHTRSSLNFSRANSGG